MAKAPETAQAAEEEAQEKKPALPPGCVRLARNFGAIQAGNHVFWQEGEIVSAPAEIEFLAAHGAPLEVG
jgi:hypothetical protein